VESEVIRVLDQVPHRESIWGEIVQIHAFLISALEGGEWSASCPGRFTLSTHWIWGWIQTQSGRGGEEKNIPSLP